MIIQKIHFLFFFKITSSISSPRTTTSPRGTRPPLKRRKIVTNTPVLFSPPVYKSVEMTPELQKLKEKAKKEEPLTKVTLEQLEELLYVLNQEKKSYARDRRYKEGLKCNNTIAFVTKYYEQAKRKENQDKAKQQFSEDNQIFEEDFQSFEKETKKLEEDLINDQKERRSLIEKTFEDNLNSFDERWNSDSKQRIYNHSTNNLNSLRMRLSFLLVDSNFKDAEQLQKAVNQRTEDEQNEHFEIMQSDHDTALAFLKNKQADQLKTFNENCEIELEKFRQKRQKKRQTFLNRQLKLKVREEIIDDPDKLWIHGQNRRSEDNMAATISTKGASIPPSGKMKRSDIKEPDAVTLVLPPLDNRRKSKKKPKPKKEEEEE